MEQDDNGEKHLACESRFRQMFFDIGNKGILQQSHRKGDDGSRVVEKRRNADISY